MQIERTYQLNTGGNADFLNMKALDRLTSKKISKTEAVQSQLDQRLSSANIHIGPSDYVPWQKDNKVPFIRLEGRGFGNMPLELELRLSVEDSPNSAGVVVDAIRCAKLALERGIGGPLEAVSAYFMKSPVAPQNLIRRFIIAFGDVGRGRGSVRTRTGMFHVIPSKIATDEVMRIDNRHSSFVFTLGGSVLRGQVTNLSML